MFVIPVGFVPAFRCFDGVEMVDFTDSGLPEQEKFTADGLPLKCIGTDDVRIELVREPGRVYKRVYRCRVYADPRAEAETGKADIRRPHVPAPLLPGSYASASVVTDVIVKKYADALPLYRQEQMWKRLGLNCTIALTVFSSKYFS